jgi:hypothetical protein
MTEMPLHSHHFPLTITSPYFLSWRKSTRKLIKKIKQEKKAKIGLRKAAIKARAKML